MIELLNFIFSGFWVWLGFLLLTSTIGAVFIATIHAVRGR